MVRSWLLTVTVDLTHAPPPLVYDLIAISHPIGKVENSLSSIPSDISILYIIILYRYNIEVLSYIVSTLDFTGF